MVSRSCGHNRNMLDIESCLVWASLGLVARSRDAHCRMFSISRKRRDAVLCDTGKASFEYVPNR